MSQSSYNNKICFKIFLSILILLYILFSWLRPSPDCSLSYFSDNSKLGRRSFTEELRHYPWKSLRNAFDSKNKEKIQASAAILLPKLIYFITKSHTISINDSCIPPPLQIPPYLSQNCTKLPLPRKIGVLFQFGFDVDALEIHLNELDEVVDKFFIVESIEAHNNYVGRKPLIWDLVKSDKRFEKFSRKIVHFIVDDADISQRPGEGNLGAGFHKEEQQERLRWLKFLRWNKATKYFNTSDLIGFGDVDEIPNRNNIFYLKNCELEDEQIDIGIWFPFGGLDTIFRSDYPVKGHPLTLGDPTYWTLRKALEYSSNETNPNNFPTRMRGTSPSFLLGGIHLSAFIYPPFQLIDFLTASEPEVGNLIRALKQYMKSTGNDGKNENVPKRFLGLMPYWLRRRVHNLGQLMKNETIREDLKKIVKIPWFYNCNRERYPYIEGKYDTRLN